MVYFIYTVNEKDYFHMMEEIILLRGAVVSEYLHNFMAWFYTSKKKMVSIFHKMGIDLLLALNDLPLLNIVLFCFVG